MPNENCLKGIKCPNCGQEDQFRIGVQTIVIMTDDGSEDDKMGGDQEWDDDSYIECVDCHTNGKVGDFRVQTDEVEWAEKNERGIYVVQVTVPSTRTLRFAVLANSDEEAKEIAQMKLEAGETPETDFGTVEGTADEADYEVIELREAPGGSDEEGGG